MAPYVVVYIVSFDLHLWLSYDVDVCYVSDLILSPRHGGNGPFSFHEAGW